MDDRFDWLQQAPCVERDFTREILESLPGDVNYAEQAARQDPLPISSSISCTCASVRQIPFFAPGWLEARTREMLEELTVEIEVDETLEIPELDEQLNVLHEEAAALYEPISERMREIRDEIDSLVERAEAPEFVPPEVEVPDLKRDWILDPDREYLAQLNAYRRHSATHHDSTPLQLSERRCPVCGDPMTHRAVQARFCSDPCRQRARRARVDGKAA